MCPRGSFTMDNTFKSARQGRTDSEKGADLRFHIEIPTGCSSPSRVRLCPALPTRAVLGAALWDCTMTLCPPALPAQLWTVRLTLLLHTCRAFSSAVPGHSQILAPLLQSLHGKSDCTPSELQVSDQLAVLTAAQQQVSPTPDRMSFPSVL